MSTLSRRLFLKSLTAATTMAAAQGVVRPLSAMAAGGPGSDDSILLVINIAGGMDIQAVLQRDFGTLADRRPTLFKNMSDTDFILPLTGTTGLHAKFSVVKDEWDEGNVAIINRVGYDNFSRSHADAEFAYARGVTDRKSSLKSGWISRLGAEYFADKPFGVWDFSGGHRTISGPYRGTTVTNLSRLTYGVDGLSGSLESAFRIDSHLAMLSQIRSPKGENIDLKAGYEGLEASVTTVEALPAAEGYPTTTIGNKFRDFDRVLNLEDTKVGYIRYGGFDTHSTQESRLDELLIELNDALSVFITRMKQRNLWNKTIIFFTSEFGRTLDENGSLGTDHGGATDALIISPLVNGGEYGRLYTAADFDENQRWIEPEVSVVNLYADLISRLGFNPAPIVEGTAGTLGIFS